MEPIVAGAGITIKARTNHNGESLINKLLGKTQGRGVVRGVLPWSASLLPVEMLHRTSLVWDILLPSCGHVCLLLGPHVQSILCCSPFRLVGIVELFCLFHISHTKVELICLFLYPTRLETPYHSITSAQEATSYGMVGGGRGIRIRKQYHSRICKSQDFNKNSSQIPFSTTCRYLNIHICTYIKAPCM